MIRRFSFLVLCAACSNAAWPPNQQPMAEETDSSPPVAPRSPPPASADAGTDAREAAADASTNAPPLAPPPRQADLFVWLDAAQLVTTSGSTVTAWSDVKAHATVMVNKATLGSLAGHAAVAGHVSTIAPAAYGEQPITIYAVMRSLAPAAQQLMIDPTGSGCFSLSKLFDDSTAQLCSQTAIIPFYANIEIPSLSSQPRIWGLRRKGSVHDARVDGKATSIDNVGGPFDMGNQISFLPDQDGVIAEALVYTADLSDLDLAAVETYLKTKYGL
jgi:hypothetical protein